MSAPVRIVVADDHNLFRAGLIELLTSVPEFLVVAECANGDDALGAVVANNPDILVLDVEMPGPGAFAVIEQLCRTQPNTKIVVLTMHDDPELVRALIEAGAVGYLLKSAGRNELMAAVNTAARTEGAVLLAVSRSTAIAFANGSRRGDSGLVSSRESEILALVAKAKSNREIARRLYISEATVKRHLANIYSKLGASSRIDAVRIAVERGILTSTFVRDAGFSHPKLDGR